MADIAKQSDGPSPTDPDSFDLTKLPDYDNDFISPDDIAAFETAINAPEPSPSQDDLSVLLVKEQTPQFITALNDWRPVRQRVRKRSGIPPRRGVDETREGYLYGILKWPLLLTVIGWILFLGITYTFTRLYIFLYEHWVTWRGRREKLRQSLRNQTSYEEWITAATKLDAFLGNDRWKTKEDYAYYDSKTIKRIRNRMIKYRKEAEAAEQDHSPTADNSSSGRAVDELRALVEGCIRDNFVGFENPRLYSETYYGTKELVQSFIDEAQASMSFLQQTKQLDQSTKREMWKHVSTNFGRAALCLSGGASFAYYHFGVAKALLDASLLPQVITGTSGGALVAALLATRTDAELKQLLVPALAHRITACQDSTWTWLRRWWRTGARFDSVDWAKGCSWFTRGSMTFREAYKRTGRILNVSCVPSDPHSPTILANYLTSPDCVIWSAVLASAAVPGILNPVVLMKKTRSGSLEPFSFGHKWKDGSLRTDIPLKALNLHFNVNFSIVSQVNPHINLFFFSSRGTVGRPVTHRRGRGWRGGFLGSATEQYLKLDMTKWLKVLRHLELLPRPMNQDWSQLWLQRFSGTITIWPKSIPSDFYYILTDPTPERLARMIRMGQLATWPKMKFIANRMKLERAIEQGRRAARPSANEANKGLGLADILSESDLRRLLRDKTNDKAVRMRVMSSAAASNDDNDDDDDDDDDDDESKYMDEDGGNAPSRGPRQIPEPEHAAPEAAQAPVSPPMQPATLGARMRTWFSRSSRSQPQSHGSPQHSRADSASSPVLVTSASSPNLQQQQQQQQHSNTAFINGMHEIYHHPSSQASSVRRESMLLEVARQSSVFFDDDDFEAAEEEEDEAGSSGSDVPGDGEDGHYDDMEGSSWKRPAGGEWAARGSASTASIEDDDDDVAVFDDDDSDEEDSDAEGARARAAGPTVLG